MNTLHYNSKTIFQSFMMKVNTNTPIKSRPVSTSGVCQRTHYPVCDLKKKNSVKKYLSLRAEHTRTLQFFSMTHTAHSSDPSGQPSYRKDYLMTKAVQNSQVNQTILQNCKEKIVALDCEMIQTESNNNHLARCSVVDFDGVVILDVYVRPTDQIIDFRTKHSGISPHHLSIDKSISFQEGRTQVLKVIKGKIVVGFAIENDLVALQCSIHPSQVVDLQQLAALTGMFNLFPNQRISLKRAAKELLKRDIQVGPHCSVEDAQATMELFRRVLPSWLRTNQGFAHRLTDDRKYLADKYWKLLPLAPQESLKPPEIVSKDEYAENASEKQPESVSKDEYAENESKEALINVGATL